VTRGRYFATVMPIAAIVYVIVLFAVGFDTKVTVIGALVLGLISMVGALVLPNRTAPGRDRNRRRNFKNS
jgi:hypothetical protein